jgi:hypothetical protein
MNSLIQSPVTTPVDRSSNPNRIPKINSGTSSPEQSMPGGYK